MPTNLAAQPAFTSDFQQEPKLPADAYVPNTARRPGCQALIKTCSITISFSDCRARQRRLERAPPPLRTPGGPHLERLDLLPSACLWAFFAQAGRKQLNRRLYHWRQNLPPSGLVRMCISEAQAQPHKHRSTKVRALPPANTHLKEPD